MHLVSILIPHFKTWRWTATCLWHFKTFGIPVPVEIFLVDNSPGHPSIKAITETELGEGITVIPGNPRFPSHGNGYDLAFNHSRGDWIFTSETDSFPTRHGWFDIYVKKSIEADLIGPEIPQSAGRYLHPAGALVSRKVLEAAREWQKSKQDWFFCPGAAIELGTSDQPYHVVAECNWLEQRGLGQALRDQVELWDGAGPFQEMRSFEDDDFKTYPQRTKITGWEPDPERSYYNKIGYEAGQWLSYFAERFFKVQRAEVELSWLKGHEGGQAAYSRVYGGFLHAWCGTVSNLPNNIPTDVRTYKQAQQSEWFNHLPEKLRHEILALEHAYS